MNIESFSTSPVSTVVESYLYQEYSDDQYLQAFVDSYNSITQGYLDWFNNTPLAIYTSSAISGSLLDWIGQGIYGIMRPIISSSTVSSYGDMNSSAMNSIAMNSFFYQVGGAAQIADDDIYKRLMTWILYRGDGKQASLQWLRRRVARFLYGANGSDISVDDLQKVSIAQSGYPLQGAYATFVYTDLFYTEGYQLFGTTSSYIQIQVSTTSAAQAMALLLASGLLPLPFQVGYQVILI